MRNEIAFESPSFETKGIIQYSVLHPHHPAPSTSVFINNIIKNFRSTIFLNNHVSSHLGMISDVFIWFYNQIFNNVLSFHSTAISWGPCLPVLCCKCQVVSWSFPLDSLVDDYQKSVILLSLLDKSLSPCSEVPFTGLVVTFLFVHLSPWSHTLSPAGGRIPFSYLPENDRLMCNY